MTQDTDQPTPGNGRAANLKAMTSNANWEARLEEARRKREEVLAAKGKPVDTPPPPLGKTPKIHEINGPAAELIDEAALTAKGPPAADTPDAPRLSELVTGAPMPTPPPKPEPVPDPVPAPRAAPPLPLGPATPPPAPEGSSAAEVLEFNPPGQPAPAKPVHPAPLRLPRSAEVRQDPPAPAPRPTPEPIAPAPLSARPETLAPPPPMRPLGPARAEDAVATPDTQRLHLIESARHLQRRRNRRLAFVIGAAFGAGLGVAFALMPEDVRNTLVALVQGVLQTGV